MTKRVLLAAIFILFITAFSAIQAQNEFEYSTNHSDCTYFGARHQEFADAGLQHQMLHRQREFSAAGKLTAEVGAALGSRTMMAADRAATATSSNTIDQYIAAGWKDAGVTPADRTTDYEFIRRVTLDLTGRVPTANAVLQFVNDTATDKRARLVDALLASPEWVDKWAMFFGDLLKNSSRSTQITRYPQGRDAFNAWIRASLAANKPYDQMARELIAARGENSWTQGELNWVAGGRMTGGPIQDTWDQQTANVMETFLGLANGNCLLCHNGRGHLDTLNLWGSQTTRMDMWQMAAYYSQISLTATRPDPAQNAAYWSVRTDSKKYPGVYPLNTSNGNRPNRVPIGSTKNVTPAYLFNGDTAKASENYQAVFANEVTADFQFARAAVNYVWKQFFNLGIVEPVNQFDPARLDADHPPPQPWTLQPSNPRLLKALAQDFINAKFDLKALMREIVLSDTYQLSSRYDESRWNPAMEPLFARHLVRRLWAEEVHDAVASTSGLLPSYTISDFGKTSYAMQLPETAGLPGGTVGRFLDSFLRGNRDDVQRSDQASVLQALNLMNDSFVVSRTHAVKGYWLADNLKLADRDLVSQMFLNVLSRQPTAEELNAAVQKLAGGNRTAQAEDLLWSLYNKVDFIFNY